MKKSRKYVLGLLGVITILLTGLIFAANYVISNFASDFVYDDLKQVPYCKVGLLLGTSPFLKSGKENQYFNYRIQAAADLYHSGKISYILISGDNGKKEYNEPEAMKQALLATGIPEERIVLDYAGFRTLDSIVRANKVFGIKRLLVISQKFHNERAVYLASYHGINAIAYNARNVDAYNGFKTNIRELLARVKVFVDICFDVQPHFLGERIDITRL